MTITWEIKRFNELTPAELYNVLRLRNEVFVVEQNCVYQDADGKDDIALHVLGKKTDEIVAYARIFEGGHYFENPSIGRVVVDAKYRQLKLGHELMREAISAVGEHYASEKITISAQSYLEKFYKQHGFIQSGEPYLEDGIPHIRMYRG